MLQLSLRLSIAATLCLTLIAGIGLAGAPSTAAASSLYVVAGNSLQIPAGGTGYLQVRGLSLQAGTNIPSDQLILATQQLQAGDRARTALYYGIDWGYSDSAPDQVALAVWWVQGGNWQSADHATAQRIADAAASSQGIPSWNPDGRNLLTAISQGQAAISGFALAQLQQTASVGSGTLSIQNRSGSDMTVYLPYGTIFSSQSGSALVWATGAGQPPQTTPTNRPASSPTSAATVAATSTAVPKASPVPPTDTPAQDTPSPTAQLPGGKGGKQPPPQQPTDTPPPIGQTKAPLYTPTSAPPPDTDTPVPPPPTDTPQPTNTPLPANTSTPVPAQSQQGTNQLPPSQPQKPVQQKGNAQGATPAGSGVGAGNQAPTSNAQASAAQPNRQPAEVPMRSASAPLPPTAGPSATPRSASGASGASGSGAAAPPPVGTVPGSGAPPPVNTAQSAPPPVSTTGAQATVPFAVQTIYPTAAVSSGLPTKQPVNTPALVQTVTKPLPTKAPFPTPAGVGAPTKAVPTPAATPAPQPGGNQSGSGTGSGQKGQPPVIVVGPSSTSNGGNKGNVSGQGQGSPPKTNPVTGAGPSSMPLWLSAGALLMLLGGWALRRVGRSTYAVRVRKE